MRTGISLTAGSSGRLRLEGVVGDRGAAQKHVWRAAIILLSADDDAKDGLTDEEVLAPRPTELGGLALENNFNALQKRRGAARKWLGDDAFNELQRQYGSATGSLSKINPFRDDTTRFSLDAADLPDHVEAVLVVSA